MKKCWLVVVLTCGLSVPVVLPVVLPAQLIAAPINQEVANMYNDGIVRCVNESCAKYLYACFRSFSAGPLKDFMKCGSQAERLNDNKMVVPRS